MVISNLKIRNFKSIASADIDFNPLTMLVGANASGKSNLINVFRFISNIANDGIDNAVALQGECLILQMPVCQKALRLK